MIKISQLHKSFGKLEVLKGIDLELQKPGIIAILGPNGSGKTTLLKTVLGMVLPDQGQIEVLGAPIHHQWEYRRQIAYLPQIARFPENLRVNELLAMISDIRGEKAQAGPLLQRFELEPYLNHRLGHLSGGTRQKVNITLAFMYDTPLIIMDEPTAGLDPVALIQLKALMKEACSKGKTILLTTHIMGLVEEMADEIVFLLEGRIYYRGAPEAIKKQYDEALLENAIAGLLAGNKAPAKMANSHVPGLKYQFM